MYIRKTVPITSQERNTRQVGTGLSTQDKEFAGQDLTKATAVRVLRACRFSGVFQHHWIVRMRESQRSVMVNDYTACINPYYTLDYPSATACSLS